MTTSTRTERRPGRPELAVFVVWSGARAHEDAIIADLSTAFAIQGVTRVRWSPDRIDENFARFYRGPVPPSHTDLFRRQKGGGPFTVISVVDQDPVYDERWTTHGPAVVNTRGFAAKLAFRELAGGGMRVHASENAREAQRDLALLLGDAAPDPNTGGDLVWNGEVRELERDLAGAGGWNSLAQLFAALDHAVEYVVLRNFEHLPHDVEFGPHTDVDVLSADYLEMIRVLGARPLHGRLPPWGGRFLVDVATRPVVFDLRFVGDGYYDPDWARAVLDRQRVSPGGVHVPSDRDYFETLAYHAYVHKRVFVQDYRIRLAEMAAASLGPPLTDPGWWGKNDDVKQLIEKLLDDTGHQYTVPRDPTVYFDHAAVGVPVPTVRRTTRRIRHALTLRWRRLTAPIVRGYYDLRGRMLTLAPWLRSVRQIVVSVRRTGQGHPGRASQASPRST